MANFWNEAILEPKRKFRWIMSINGIPYFTIKETSRPSYEVGVATHEFINHTFNFPGKVKYNDIEVKIIDSANPDAAETLRQIIFAGGYRLPTSAPVGTQSITKLGAVNALGEVQISILGGGGEDGSGAGGGSTGGVNDEGDVLENWVLHNAWIMKVDFDPLSYGDDELAQVTLTIKYDYAVLNRTSAAPYGGKSVVTSGDLTPRGGGGSYNVPPGTDPERQD